jgi:hypothetical protein
MLPKASKTLCELLDEICDMNPRCLGCVFSNGVCAHARNLERSVKALMADCWAPQGSRLSDDGRPLDKEATTRDAVALLDNLATKTEQLRYGVCRRARCDRCALGRSFCGDIKRSIRRSMELVALEREALW